MIEERDVAPSGRKAQVAIRSEPPRAISEIASETIQRIRSGLKEFDEILGGGLVPGSVVLIGGEPGIGKSTLLLQVAEYYAKEAKTVLYVSGEESASQIALRSQRLGIQNENLLVVAETLLEQIQNHIEKFTPGIVVLDSIQTIYSASLESQPGSVGQLRECAYQIISLAKAKNIAVFLVGHVTKDGSIAGPKLLEHMVDVVLYFEDSSSHSFRLLRTMKNRFGSTHEVGIFEMGNEGLKPVVNPSEFFLSERPRATPGSVVAASLEGTRPILVEVQALVASSSLALPRRTAIGIDPNRVSVLVAILDKRVGLHLFDQDVYVNIAGGLRLTEPAIDLAVVGALLSSFTGKTVPKESMFFGEVGLGGEVRSVPKAEMRLKEALRVGMKCAYVPKRVAAELEEISELKLVPIEHVSALKNLIG